jgi:hypothetical protein
MVASGLPAGGDGEEANGSPALDPPGIAPQPADDAIVIAKARRNAAGYLIRPYDATQGYALRHHPCRAGWPNRTDRDGPSAGGGEPLARASAGSA